MKVPHTITSKAYWHGLNGNYSNELPEDLGFDSTEENKATWKKHYDEGANASNGWSTQDILDLLSPTK